MSKNLAERQPKRSTLLVARVGVETGLTAVNRAPE
jgi:hypothetical protein